MTMIHCSRENAELQLTSRQNRRLSQVNNGVETDRWLSCWRHNTWHICQRVTSTNRRLTHTQKPHYYKARTWTWYDTHSLYRVTRVLCEYWGNLAVMEWKLRSRRNGVTVIPRKLLTRVVLPECVSTQAVKVVALCTFETCWLLLMQKVTEWGLVLQGRVQMLWGTQSEQGQNLWCGGGTQRSSSSHVTV